VFVRIRAITKVHMAAHSESKQPLFFRFSWLYAPVLAAIFPVLQLYANSVREADPADAAICGVIVVGAAVTLAYLLRFVYSDAKRAGFAAVVVIVWCFTFSGYVRLGRMATEAASSSSSSSSSPLIDLVLMLFWLVLLFSALWLLFRIQWSEYRIGRVYRFVKLACLFAVIFAVYQAVRGNLLTDVVDAPVSIWASDSEPIPDTWKPTPPTNPRDVYYLIFDRYANDAALRRFFQFDNSEFYNELEKRGFVVDRNATSSYPMTMPSMSSTLNMRYLSSVVGTIAEYGRAVQSNQVGKSFIKAGYQYHYFGNQYEPLRNSSVAHWNMKISLLPSEFDDSLVNMTPLRPLIGRHYKRTLALNRFAQIAKLANDPALTFAYAHFLIPHPPYAFARDGSAQSETNRATWTEQQLYVDQLIATNSLILKLIDEILSSSNIKPIIIVQSDEGPYLMSGDKSLSRDEQIAKRTGILNAILIPDGEVRQQLPAQLMPVNTFRFLFKEYFAAPIALLPDRVFYWDNPTPNGVATPGTHIVEVHVDPQN
jgi:hypothetical protein